VVGCFVAIVFKTMKKNVANKKVEKNMKLITWNLPIPYIKKLDALVRNGYYPNRAEAIRMAIRDMILEEKDNG